MKALTLTQPWATLMVSRAPGAIVPPKAIETRNWSTRHRGRLYIHAAKGFPRAAVETCFIEPFRSVLMSLGITTPGLLKRGTIIGAVDVHDVKEITPGYLDVIRLRYGDEERARLEFAFGNYDTSFERRYAWWCGAAHEFAEPLACRGSLGLWDVPRDIAASIRQMETPSAEAVGL